MSDIEVYTIANGLSVSARKIDLISGTSLHFYHFYVKSKPSWDHLSNTLWEVECNRDNTGLKINTDSKIFTSTWHLSIEKNQRVLVPWERGMGESGLRDFESRGHNRQRRCQTLAAELSSQSCYGHPRGTSCRKQLPPKSRTG
jgi:hypothetical protein